MKEKNKYSKIVVGLFIVSVLLFASFFVYKALNKDTKPAESEEKKNETVSKITPILYEVTKAGSNNKIYLFGSIHVADKGDLIFPEYVLNAYNNSHFLACELNSTGKELEMQQMLLDNIYYKDGTTVKDHLKEETYNKVVELLNKKGGYNSTFDSYKPYAFFSLIEQYIVEDSKLDMASSVDSYFINKAIDDKKTILEVESFEYQMNLFLNLSDFLYDILLTDMVDNYDDQVKGIKDLYEKWKKGDEKEILSAIDEEIDMKDEYTDEQKNAVIDYNQQLIDNRNLAMTDKVIEYFENNQDVFFMVGTAHVVGESGIATYLQQRGYTVTKVN